MLQLKIYYFYWPEITKSIDSPAWISSATQFCLFVASGISINNEVPKAACVPKPKLVSISKKFNK